MAGLSLTHLYKVYPNGTKAVNDLNLEIKDKEFIVFVGPSGCGKSTSLRMIAGLEEITAGEIRIDDEIVNDLGPSERDTAMVFQNYSLYPHLTVFQNIAFPLRMMKLPKEEIFEKVIATAKILDLEKYLDQKPDTLSGGQRQRVALGRAIVREPKVFLLDEPLSNLDAKLRTQMRTEITKLHKRLQTTFIYVTHDQVEAMTMGDRIVVMKDGFVQQIDTPTNLYRYPLNKFVAGFIGSPPMNFYDARVFIDGDKAEIIFGNNQKVVIDALNIIKLDKDYHRGKPLIMGVRPESISIVNKKSPASVACKVIQKEILGSETLLYSDLDINSTVDYENSLYGLIIKVPGFTEINEGSLIEITFDFKEVHFFDPETEECVSKRMVEKEKLTVNIASQKMNFCGEEINLPDALKALQGEYEILFPTIAVRIGNSFKATVAFSEKIEDKYLTRLTIGNAAFWAVFPEELKGTVNLELDLKKLEFYKNGECIQKAMPAYNALRGKLVKRKRKIKNEYGLKFDVLFVVDDIELECPEEIIKRVLGISDRKIFDVPLELRFKHESIIFGGNIKAKVLEQIDYGKEKYWLSEVANQQILLPYRSDSELTFNIDLKDVSIIDIETGIRIA